ncbi:AMP-binding protein [Streptomyces sp. NPDC001251]
MNRADLSFLDGGPAPRPAHADLGSALRSAARQGNPEGLCFLDADGTETRMSYAELLDAASRILGGLRAAGAAPGETVLLQIRSEPELIAAFWGCVLGGFVPMPVAAGEPGTPGGPAAGPASGAGQLHRVWTRYGRPRTVLGAGQPVAPATRSDPGWPGALAGDTRRLLSHLPDRSWHRAGPDDPAVLLLTSGSTGTPKAVPLTHRNLLTRSAATAQANGLSVHTRSFNWMPLDHVGGLVLFHLRDVYLGAYQVHAPRSYVLQDPLRWLTVADRHRVCTTWAPNFAFQLLTDQAARLRGRSLDLSGLRYVMNGGEAVRATVVRAFLDLLRPFGLGSDVMYPGWGMSETSSGVIDMRFEPAAGDERYVPVGRPQPGTAVRCVDDDGDLVPQGTPGHLEVSGTAVTRGYHDNPVQNLRSFTADGWFRTGDRAFVESGRLTVTGRADDVIECGGVTCHSHEIEAVVEELDFVTPSYTVAGPVAVDGREELAVFFHRRGAVGAAEAEALIRRRVEERLGLNATRIVPVDPSDVPKTGIGKLRRSRLREQYEASAARCGGSPGTTPENGPGRPNGDDHLRARAARSATGVPAPWGTPGRRGRLSPGRLPGALGP